MIDTDKYEGHTKGPWRIVESDSGTGYGDGTYYLGLVGDTLITELSFRSNEHESHPDVQLMADAPLLLAEVKRLRDLHILACDYLQDISDGTLPDSEWPHIHAMIRGDEE